jgi:hypothetical protein
MLRMSNVWSLIKDGKFRDASALAEQQYALTKDVLCLRNGVLALLNLGELQSAIDLSKRVIQIRNGDTDSDYIFLGVAFWLCGRHVEALRAWEDGMRCDYKDAAGGLEVLLLRYFAAVKLRNTQLLSACEGLLEKKYPNVVQVWPGPIASFLLKMTSAEGVCSVMSASSIVKSKQTCQSSFYFGVAAWQQSGSEAAKPFFLDATRQGVVTLTKQEYYLAKHELSQIAVRGQR